jgi:hypothetical protein
MFSEFFVTLHPNAQPVFVKVLELINHPELNMSKDQKADLLNRYQNFFITALLHTVKFKAGQDEKSLNEWYGLFFGDHSFAIQLKNLQSNAKYKDNLALKQLFPLINSNRNATDNVKLFNNKQSTYEMNLIAESLIHLKQQAEAENDIELRQFVARLGAFAILQSGVQMSPITYAKVLPIEVYSSIVGTILDRFTQADMDSFNPDLIWKQFHQNNWYNNQIVPRVKRYNREKNGLITVSANYNVSNYDYISVQELKSDLVGEKNPKRLELVKQKKWNEIYDHGLYERIRFQDETGNDITDRQPVRYYRPVNRLGNGMHMTEVYTMARGSILAENKAFDEAVFDGAVQDIVSSLSKPVPISPVDRALGWLDCSR